MWGVGELLVGWFVVSVSVLGEVVGLVFSFFFPQYMFLLFFYFT